MTRRQSITFTGEGAALVEKLAKERGKTVSEIVRDAVVLEDWRYRTEQQGNHIFAGKNREEAHEVQFING
jgi:hypothetical protein